MLPSVEMEKILYNGIRQDPQYLRICKPSFFENKDLQILIRIDKKFEDTYKEVPTKDQILHIVQNNKISQITENKLDAIFDVDLDEYQKQWLKENVIAWIEWRALQNSIEDVLEYVQTINVDPSNVRDISQKVKDIILEQNNITIDYDIGLDFFDPDAHKQPTFDTFDTGYRFLNDKLGGGWQKKTLVCIIGQPKSGKCVFFGEQIKIRNKETHEIKEVTIGDFFNSF